MCKIRNCTASCFGEAPQSCDVHCAVLSRARAGTWRVAVGMGTSPSKPEHSIAIRRDADGHVLPPSHSQRQRAQRNHSQHMVLPLARTHMLSSTSSGRTVSVVRPADLNLLLQHPSRSSSVSSDSDDDGASDVDTHTSPTDHSDNAMHSASAGAPSTFCGTHGADEETKASSHGRKTHLRIPRSIAGATQQLLYRRQQSPYRLVSQLYPVNSESALQRAQSLNKYVVA